MTGLQIDAGRVFSLANFSAAARKVDDPTGRPNQTAPPPPAQKTDAEIQAEMEARLRADNKGGPGLGPPLSGQPQFDNDVSHLRAEIKIDGKVVARIYNSGASEIADGYGYLALEAGFGGAGEGSTVGPDLGDMRIAALAKLLDGEEVVMAKTAQTQAQWLAEKAKMAGSILDINA